MKIFYLILFLSTSTYYYSQPTIENFELSFKYIVINDDTTFLDRQLDFKPKRELKAIEKDGGLKLIEIQESIIKYGYNFDVKRNDIITAFHLNFWLEIDGKKELLELLYYPIYFKNKAKNNKVHSLKKSETKRILIENDYPNSSIKSAIIKFDFTW